MYSDREARLLTDLEITQHQVTELTKERDRFKALYEQEQDDLRIASEMAGKLQDQRDELRRKLAESEAEAEKWRRKLQREICQNAPLRKALRPFAERFGSEFQDFEGMEEIEVNFEVQVFKDAKAAMKLMDAKEG